MARLFSLPLVPFSSQGKLSSSTNKNCLIYHLLMQTYFLRASRFNLSAKPIKCVNFLCVVVFLSVHQILSLGMSPWYFMQLVSDKHTSNTGKGQVTSKEATHGALYMGVLNNWYGCIQV